MWYISDKKNKYCETYASSKYLFSKEECELIIKEGLDLHVQKAEILDNHNTYFDDIRNNLISWISPENENTRWIYERCLIAIKEANDTIFNYDLTYGEDIQFTIYDQIKHHYVKHTDISINGDAATRKLTFSVQLSDPEYYEGSRLMLHTGHEPIEANIEQGTINFFPSYVLHEVTPLISGKRYSLVGWVHGPKFR